MGHEGSKSAGFAPCGLLWLLSFAVRFPGQRFDHGGEPSPSEGWRLGWERTASSVLRFTFFLRIYPDPYTHLRTEAS